MIKRARNKPASIGADELELLFLDFSIQALIDGKSQAFGHVHDDLLVSACILNALSTARNVVLVHAGTTLCESISTIVGNDLHPIVCILGFTDFSMSLDLMNLHILSPKVIDFAKNLPP